MKVVINRCYGGFSLSKDAYAEIGLPWDGYGYAFDNDRTNEQLVAAVEKLGKRANGSCAELKVVDITDDVAWEIDYYDGMERVVESSRSWE